MTFTVIIYTCCLQLALIDSEVCDKKNGIDSEEVKILDELGKCFNAKDKKNIVNRAIVDIRKIRREYDKVNIKKEFDIDLRKVKTIAREDYEVFTDVLDTIINECNYLEQKITNYQGIKNKALKLSVEEFSKKYQEEIFNEIQMIKANSFQKELASKNFSIALMGRTKAGKSTLHSVMCDEGEEFIGKGRQRTTRFNRVFTWNGLKIIDTPGIGAGEIEGEKDTEIAYKTISQADIICYVVADDSITEEILKMLDEIAMFHKPLIVVLNHKDDINKKSHLKTFIENPNDWKDTVGEKNLAGWVNRLKRNAEKGGYGDSFKVIPVFLLATIKGKKENNKMFYKASNYDSFIKTIEEIISKNSMIYKSQTMLNEPSIHINLILNRLKVEKNRLISFKDKVEKIRKRTTQDLGFLHREVRIGIETGINTIFDNFKTQCEGEFVEKCHNNRDVTELKATYLGFISEFKIQDKIQYKAEEVFMDYREKINSIVNDLEDEIRYADINISKSINEDGVDNLKIPFANIPIKGTLKVISMGLDVAAIWIPFLALISVPISIISGLFKSQNQKIDESKKIAMENFSLMVVNQEKRYKESVMREVYKCLEQDEREIDFLLNPLLEQSNEVLEYIQNCEKSLEDNLKRLNNYYAARILEFICESNNELIIDAENDVNSFRNYTNHVFDIRTRVNENYNVKKIRNLTGEKVSIRII